MQQALQIIRTEHPPTTQRLSHAHRQGVIWVQPRLVAKVQYRSWSSDGLLRRSSFKAFLPDTRPSKVHKPKSLTR
jgi:bifunctional non-homologous end joining protein LigD